jgi:cell division protein FtsB
MREYQQRHMIRTLLYSRVTIIILFVLIILLLRSIMELNDKRIEVTKLRNDTAKEKATLTEKVAIAEKQNALIATDRGFEEYVRSTYPVVKDGEGVIVLYDEGKNPVSVVRTSMTVWERITVWLQSILK